MTTELSLVIALVLALILSVLATAVYLPLARRRSWVDSPVARSSHEVPTLSSGGIAVMTALMASFITLHVSGLAILSGREAAALFGVALLCLLGARDDRRSLSVRVRLTTQFVIAGGVLVAYGGLAMHWTLVVVLLVGLTWLVNLYNFMDGIDGIAALQCALTATCLGVLGVVSGADISYLAAAMVVAGAYLGFLMFNWPPAKLFMGDAGSLAAGMLLGWLGLWSWWAGWLSPVAWLLLMSPFVLDTGVTLMVRLLRGESPGQAHRSHLYQRLARHWGSHRKVDLALLSLHIFWLFPLSLGVALNLASPITFLALGLFPQIVLMAKWRSLQ